MSDSYWRRHAARAAAGANPTVQRPKNRLHRWLIVLLGARYDREALPLYIWRGKFWLVQ